MNINSNKYTFFYAVVLVLVVAVVLSVAATTLKPKQDANIRIEKMQNILQAAATGNAIEITAENAEDLYQKYIVQELTVSPDGKIISDYDVKSGTFSTGNVRAFDLDLKIQLEKLNKSESAGLPIFVYQSETEKRYVFPVRGTGLWGPIWGNIALSENLTTIEGVNFDHKGETPGLGADIATEKFKSEFVGKTIMNENGEMTPLLVVKGGIQKLPENECIHAVDALSGATITSNGVQTMIQTIFGFYEKWMTSQSAEKKTNEEGGAL